MHRATFSVLQTSSIRHHQLLSPVRTTYFVKTDGQPTWSSMGMSRITIGSGNEGALIRIIKNHHPAPPSQECWISFFLKLFGNSNYFP